MNKLTLMVSVATMILTFLITFFVWNRKHNKCRKVWEQMTQELLKKQEESIMNAYKIELRPETLGNRNLVSYIDIYEQTRVKELRMIKNGHGYCFICGRVTGIFYKYPDGKTKGISIRNIDNKTYCEDCLEKYPELCKRGNK